MNKKFLFMCLLSCISAQSLFPAAQSDSSVVNKIRPDKWREIAFFPYLNGMSCKNYLAPVSDTLASYDPEKRVLSMGKGKVQGIQDEDLPLVDVVLKEVQEAYARFNTQAKK